MIRTPKIESVESLLLGATHFVRIRTDNGIEGLGQSACWAYPEAAHALIESFQSYLVGQDALRIEHHWQYLHRMGPFRGSVLGGALSAIDIALWDIKGRHYGAPIWDLLGGRCRDRVRLHLLLLGDYTPQSIATATRDGVAKGFTAVKFDPVPDGYADMTIEALVRAVEARVEAARDAVDGDADIILEFHRKLTPLQAYTVLQAVARFNVLACEDPIQIDSIASQADLAKRLPQPMANGERLHTIWEFKELLAQGGPQFVRPDLGLAGGLTHVKKIAAIAEAHHAAVLTHNFLGPVLTAASVHLDVAIPNVVTQEYTLSDEDDGWAGLDGRLARDGGYLSVPDAPGLGITLKNPEAITEAAPQTRLHPIPLRDDGSVAFSV